MPANDLLIGWVALNAPPPLSPQTCDTFRGCYPLMAALNPLLREFFLFRRFLRDSAKIGSYHLPTHRRGAQMFFIFIFPFYFKIKILAGHTYTIVTDTQKRVNIDEQFTSRRYFPFRHDIIGSISQKIARWGDTNYSSAKQTVFEGKIIVGY